MLPSALPAPVDTTTSTAPAALASSFDRVVALAHRLLGAPMVYVTHAESNRLMLQSHVGLDADVVSRATMPCAYTLRANEVVVSEDVLLDPRFAGQPFVSGAPGIRFYAGLPLRSPEGFAVGTFCLAAPTPRVLAGARSPDRRR